MLYFNCYAAERRRRRHLIDAAAAKKSRSARRRRRSKNHPARRRRKNDAGAGLYWVHRDDSRPSRTCTRGLTVGITVKIPTICYCLFVDDSQKNWSIHYFTEEASKARFQFPGCYSLQCIKYRVNKVFSAWTRCYSVSVRLGLGLGLGFSVMEINSTQ